MRQVIGWLLGPSGVRRENGLAMAVGFGAIIVAAIVVFLAMPASVVQSLHYLLIH